jgi:Flp pilus assembly protein protease CpaA
MEMTWLEGIIFVIMAGFTVWLTLTDVSERMIPDTCSFGTIALGFLNWATLIGDPYAKSKMLISSIVAGAVLATALAMLFASNSFGAGDAKLMIGCSLFMLDVTSGIIYAVGMAVCCLGAIAYKKAGGYRMIPGGPVIAFPGLLVCTVRLLEGTMSLSGNQVWLGLVLSLMICLAVFGVSLIIMKALRKHGRCLPYKEEAAEYAEKE